MSRLCPLTGKRTSVGHNVSHSQRKTKRKFYPNLITKKVFDSETGQRVKMRISTAALRTLTKMMGK